MIDVEVVEKKSNNYLPLLLFLLCGFLFTLKKILFNIGLVKLKSLSFKEDKVFTDSISSSFSFLYLDNQDKDLDSDNYNNDKNIEDLNLDYLKDLRARSIYLF